MKIVIVILFFSKEQWLFASIKVSKSQTKVRESRSLKHIFFITHRLLLKEKKSTEQPEGLLLLRKIWFKSILSIFKRLENVDCYIIRIVVL